jgi:hypothetical protein
VVDDGAAVDVCFETRYIKGGELFPPEFCTSEYGEPLPISGTLVKITDEDGEGFIMRVTEAK